MAMRQGMGLVHWLLPLQKRSLRKRLRKGMYGREMRRILMGDLISIGNRGIDGSKWVLGRV